MNIEEIIRQAFNNNKISQMQLDPNGHCNAACWFCPVSVKGNPKHAKKPMPVSLLRKIIENMIEERDREDGLVSKNFGGFYTTHCLKENFKNVGNRNSDKPKPKTR